MQSLSDIYIYHDIGASAGKVSESYCKHKRSLWNTCWRRKKTQKTPVGEIERALRIMNEYFAQKNNKRRTNDDDKWKNKD